MLAVLEDAIFCLQNFPAARDLRQKTIFRNAKNWLLSDRIDWPFSYRNVCDVLGIDANYLRQGLVRWQDTCSAEIKRGGTAFMPAKAKQSTLSKFPCRSIAAE